MVKRFENGSHAAAPITASNKTKNQFEMTITFPDHKVREKPKPNVTGKKNSLEAVSLAHIQVDGVNNPEFPFAIMTICPRLEPNAECLIVETTPRKLTGGCLMETLSFHQ